MNTNIYFEKKIDSENNTRDTSNFFMISELKLINEHKKV